MELNFLGSDSGFGKENTSAYYETEDKLTIIDCGFTVFGMAKDKFDFNKYENVEVVITHMHNDHVGTLSQLILYLWFNFHKKVTVISKCDGMKEYLDITGTPEEAYELKDGTMEIKFIETTHAPDLDAYGFTLKTQDKTILYTGDTSTLASFRPYFSEISELYVDSSTTGGVHLKIDDALEELNELEANNVDVFLMHLDNKEKIRALIHNTEIDMVSDVPKEQDRDWKNENETGQSIDESSLEELKKQKLALQKKLAILEEKIRVDRQKKDNVQVHKASASIGMDK